MPEVLRLLMDIRLELQFGRSVSNALTEVLKSPNGEFCRDLRKWLVLVQGGEKSADAISKLPALSLTSARRSLLFVLEKGVTGSPIDELLADLEVEFENILINQFERSLQLLPYKLMIPLMVFVLPAVLLLILGPLWNSIKTSF